MKKAALVLFLQACCLLQFVAQATPDRPLRDEVCLNGVWNLEIEGVEKPAQVRVPGFFAGQDELWGKEHWDVWDYPKDWRNKPATYVRSIEVPENLGNRRVLIHIGGVRHVVKVSVNGKEVGNWWDSYVPFEFDITEAVKPGDNEIRIHVSDAKTCGLFVDYNSSRRGIYRDVFLKFVLEVRVTPDLFVKTSVQRGEIACDVPVRNDTPNPLPDYLVGTNIGGAKTAVALPLMGFFGDSVTLGLAGPLTQKLKEVVRMDKPAVLSRSTLAAGEAKAAIGDKKFSRVVFTLGEADLDTKISDADFLKNLDELWKILAASSEKLYWIPIPSAFHADDSTRAARAKHLNQISEQFFEGKDVYKVPFIYAKAEELPPSYVSGQGKSFQPAEAQDIADRLGEAVISFGAQ